FILLSVMKDGDGTASKKTANGVASCKRNWSFEELRKAEEKMHPTTHAANQVNFSSIKHANLQPRLPENALPVIRTSSASVSFLTHSIRHTATHDVTSSPSPSQ
ncbi:hypothetical protein PMAYCL1PPCAC_26018, partial [Pristionchus mayeri]